MTSDFSSAADKAVRLILQIALPVSIFIGSVDLFVLGLAPEPNGGSGEGQRVLRLAVLGPLSIVAAAKWRELKRLMRQPEFATLGFFGAATMAAAFATDQPAQNFERAVFFAAFLGLVATAGLLLGQRKTLVSLTVSGLLLTGLGSVGHIAGLLPTFQNEFFDGAILPFARASGIQPSANEFARSAVVLVILGALMLQKRWHFRLGLLAVGVGVFGVVLSQSRIPALALVVAVIVMVSPQRLRQSRAALPAFALAVLSGVTVLFAARPITAGLRSQDSAEASTLFGRTEVWAEAIAVWDSAPIFGIGMESLNAHFGAWHEAGLIQWDPSNAHNIFLQIAAAHGSIALVAFVATLYCGLRFAKRENLLDVQVLLLTLLIMGLTEAIFRGTPDLAVAAPFAMLAASSPTALWLAGRDSTIDLTTTDDEAQYVGPVGIEPTTERL